MAALRPNPDAKALKKRAVDDAKSTQQATEQTCLDSGIDPPPYILSELIGKGSFGRVYKATEKTPNQDVVAIKIISIEDGDSLQPKAADTFGDILKEVHALKLLAESGAKNINPVLDTLLIGHSMWVVTEYCAGGSIATLMRPTRGLPERWMIPVLRGVAEALSWVHRQGIIHRDVKCANVFVTETGDVQLGDFGVAGLIETTFDKRSTVTGSLHWMAPELFQSIVSYGTEVDIWAFGSMAYEIATGLPPNARTMIDLQTFGDSLAQNCPRLEGDKYSPRLKDMVACCLVEDPAERPSIDSLKIHPYIFRSETQYPYSSLSKLVKSYKLWESQGGSRQSLFYPGSAGEFSSEDLPEEIDDWNFTTEDEDDDVDGGQDTIKSKSLNMLQLEDAATSKGTRRRRPAPPNLKPLTIPLEKVFNTNTITNYRNNAQVFYGGFEIPARPTPVPQTYILKDLSPNGSVISLDTSPGQSDVPWPIDSDTIRPARSTNPSAPDSHNRRRTLDWTFAAASSAEDENEDTDSWQDMSKEYPDESPSNQYPQQAQSLPIRASTLSLIDLDQGLYSNRTSMNPTGKHISTMSLIDLDESIYSKNPTSTNAARKHISTTSLIDLDEGLFNDTHSDFHYSTTRLTSTLGDPAPPAGYERVRRATEPTIPLMSAREPSIYAEDIGFAMTSPSQSTDVFDLEPSPSRQLYTDDFDRSNNLPPEHDPAWQARPSKNRQLHHVPTLALPALPSPPSAHAIQNFDGPGGLKSELCRLISSLGDHLEWSSAVLETLPLKKVEQYSR